MNKKISSILQYLFFLGVGIFLVWWGLGKISHKGWGEMKAALGATDYWLMVPVTFALLLSHYSRAIRWKILMEPLGYAPSTVNTYFAVLIGYMANLALPRLGEVLKCTILSRYEKVPADKLVGTIVAERAFDLICLLIVFFITIVSQIDVIGQYAIEMINEIITGGTGAINYSRLFLFFLILLVIGTGLLYALKKYSHLGFVRKVNAVAKGVWEGLTSVRFVKKKGWFFFHSIFIWFLYLASIRIGFLAMEPTNNYGWLPSFSVLSLGSVGMIVTQGGIGAYPILVQETLVQYGLGENIGKAFGWLLWSAQFLLVTVSGLTAWLMLPVLNRKKSIGKTATL